MLTEEYLTKIGKLFKRAQYQKCEKSLLECLSDYEQSYGASRNSVSCEDFCKKSGESNKIASSCSAVFRCIFQQNTDLCAFLCGSANKKSSDGEVILPCERFNRLLQDMLGWAVSEHHVDTEVVILHNYLNILLGHHISEVQVWSENAFTLISTVLNRAFELRTGSVASVHRPITEEIISLLDCILCHTEGMTEFALEALSALCFAMFYLLIIHDISLPVHYVKKIMSKMELACRSEKQKKCRRPGFVCLHPSSMVTPGVPTHSDSLQLLLACNYMAIEDIYTTHMCLERITYSGWEHFIGYIKAFLLFKEKQYDQALENSWPLWKTKQKAESWMVSRLSNFIGCCLFKKGCFSMSLNWFQKSVNSDFSYLLPLWNLASAFKCLGKNDASLEVLENLEKASSINSDKHPSYLFCKYLLLQNQPEIAHVQALYLLAHQCLSFCHYSLSAQHFTKILNLLKEKPLEDLPHSIHFGISLLDIYVEACYAYLHSGMYDDCLKTSNSAAEYFPSSDFVKQDELPFSWNMGKKLLGTSHFKHRTKNSLSAGKFGKLSLNNHSAHPELRGVKQNNLISGRTENDEIFLMSNNSVGEVKVDKKGEGSHDHVKPYRIMHLIIEASAKYSLNCTAEAVDKLRRALSATRHYQETEENTGICVSSKGQDNSSSKLIEESCPVCSNLISSMVSQIYNNLAIISISKGHLKEAAHNLRVALMHDSNNIDAVYNYCLLQIKLEQAEVAQSFWEASKLRCDRIKSILDSGDCNSMCTVTADLLKSLNEALSLED